MRRVGEAATNLECAQTHNRQNFPAAAAGGGGGGFMFYLPVQRSLTRRGEAGCCAKSCDALKKSLSPWRARLHLGSMPGEEKKPGHNGSAVVNISQTHKE